MLKQVLALLCLSLLLIAMGFAVSGCSDEPTAIRVLTNDGYTAVKITGYKAFGCHKDDMWSTGFEATNVSGHHVTGAVCTSAWPSSTNTIRVD